MLRSGLLKRILIAVSITVIILFAYFSYFLVSNEAPIIKGKIHYGISYKEGLTLDIYSPLINTDDRSPVIVFFHGGGWIAGRKESINFNRFNIAINELRENGYAVVTPEYTLASREESPFPSCIVDAYDAIRWIRENVGNYNFDLENVGLFGESAGGHIALMTAYTNPELFNSNPHNISINYVVDIYGPTDLKELYHAQAVDSVKALLAKLPEKLERHLDITERLFGFDPDEEYELAETFMQQYSPINYVSPDSPPTLIIHGTNDILVPLSQSLTLNKTLSENGVSSEMYTLKDVNHAFIGATDQQSDDIQQWVIGFIEKYRK